jgi:hypothetical protein
MPKRFNAEREDEVLDVEMDLDDLDSEYSEFDLEEFRKRGIDPFKPTEARPGSEDKVLMLSARYAAGLPLWHNEDCYDHGPQESELMGMPFPVVAPTAESLIGTGNGAEEEVEEVE